MNNSAGQDMTPAYFKGLRERLNLTATSCAALLDLADSRRVEAIEAGQVPVPDNVWLRLTELDSLVQSFVLDAVDDYAAGSDNEIVLVRFLTDADFALYEPIQQAKIYSAEIQGALVERIETAVGSLGGRVLIAYMDSEFYPGFPR